MTSAKRRSVLRFLGGAPLLVLFPVSSSEARAAGAHAAGALQAAAKGKPYKPKFFTAHEWETVRLLTDMIIPKNERSGSATDAGVPEFMDFLMTDAAEDNRSLEARQTSMRGGLAWIDNESRRRFGKTFVACSDEERVKFLDEIAFWTGADEDDDEKGDRRPDDLRVLPLRHGPAFFASFRDLTASGFWSTKMGVADLGYIGNTATVWEGPPPEVLRKIGIGD